MRRLECPFGGLAEGRGLSLLSDALLFPRTCSSHVPQQLPLAGPVRWVCPSVLCKLRTAACALVPLCRIAMRERAGDLSPFLALATPSTPALQRSSCTSAPAAAGTKASVHHTCTSMSLWATVQHKAQRVKPHGHATPLPCLTRTIC